ncbi:hypothetical protein [Methylomagnum sp.]
MRPSLCIATLAMLALSHTADAGSVFRCVENGKTSFSETATGPTCQPLNIKDNPPTHPRDLARQQQTLEEWSRQRDFEVQNILRREAIARSEELKARLKALGPAPARAEAHASRRRARRQGAVSQGTQAPQVSQTRQAPAAASHSLGK